MRLADIPSERIILILGAPRSGTSWLAKIFDSHPDVLYRHEPRYAPLRTLASPGRALPEQVATVQGPSRSLHRQLIEIATLKSAGSLPIFRSTIEALPRRPVYTGMTHGLRAVELLRSARPLVRDVPIFDRIDVARHPELRVVMKSVSSRGRARSSSVRTGLVRMSYLLPRDPFGQARPTSCAPLHSRARGRALWARCCRPNRPNDTA